MASQVLSGTGNVSYTNNTGQNVRIVINYMQAATPSPTISMSWAGVTISYVVRAIGRNLAHFGAVTGGYGNNLLPGQSGISTPEAALPTELMLGPGQSFSAGGIDAYNIVVIPEAG